MKQIISVLLFVVCNLSVASLSAQEDDRTETLVLMETSMGKIKIKLFNDTPLHRDNFIKNVEAQTYNGTLFHRVIKQFMIQGGGKAQPKETPKADGQETTTDTAAGEEPEKPAEADLTIPAEIVYPKYFHKRGMLCAARTGDDVNPEKASSSIQFYIITGKYFTDMELTKMEEAQHITLTPEQRKAYMLEGGSPHLDGNYTVYGEVVDGIKVVDKIQFVPVNEEDRPVKDVVIKSMAIVKK